MLVAVVGACVTAVLMAWQGYSFTRPNPDPLIHTHRLTLYWVEDRWRWPFMVCAALSGVAGLARLAGRGRPLAALWFGGAFLAAVLGVAGFPVPVWHRFLLYGQIPLAIGVGVVLAEGGSRLRSVAGWTLGGVGAFKLVALLALPVTITYFGSPLQPAYALGRAIPPGPGLVASDPFTSYYVPAATGHRVLVVTKGHVGSQLELDTSAGGYLLLHRFATARWWWGAAQELYRRGVRYVVIEKSTSLRAPDLPTFSTGPTPLVRTRRDRRVLGSYYYRNNKVGVLIADTTSYAVYQLSRRRLW
jgi:hypothetical protein